MSIHSKVMVSTALPPPLSEAGMAGWMRFNLFSSWYNSVLTIILSISIALALWFGLSWIILQADWSAIYTLGGRFIIGQYNVEAACPGQNCFWRPQASLLLITVLLGMGWRVAGGGITKRIAIIVAGVASAFAFLPYGLNEMGWDVRLLLLANVPALAAGWSLARFTKLGTTFWVFVFTMAAFVLTVVLLRGIPGVPFLQPVLVIYWGGMMLNLLLAVVGIGLSFPIGIALAYRYLGCPRVALK